MIDQVKAQNKEKHFDLYSCNAEAVNAFLMVETQWQGEGRGLDYGNAEVAWRLAGLNITPDIFKKIQVLEVEAMNAAREQHEQI
ncbi:DUF1799 domain-containing protein [Pseudoalteromonas sp. Ps84H-4]|uniref:DUF1799 domain-containing protein n=1 Tax=Pseudoalteromonas sp. Ps84H-4 TaxID=2954502 RepID=UPI002096C016|nr:DUF1799 domain-containing protein [Pseudoalteromonas sp. Ps84H-4]